MPVHPASHKSALSEQFQSVKIDQTLLLVLYLSAVGDSHIHHITHLIADSFVEATTITELRKL